MPKRKAAEIVIILLIVVLIVIQVPGMLAGSMTDGQLDPNTSIQTETEDDAFRALINQAREENLGGVACGAGNTVVLSC
jgi:hypothetical protein